MSALLADIEFGAAGNSAAFVREGWAEAETSHRWTMGRESRLVLPVDDVGPNCVLAICATPCRHPPDLPGQAVMLAFGDRLLAAADFPGLRTFAFRLPAMRGEIVLRLLHANVMAPRAPNQFRRGQPLGLMVHSVRLYRLPGSVARPAVFAAPAASQAALALRFESIGQGCQFGLIQRDMGAEPVSLLRFVDTTTSMVANGLVRAFAGVDRPDGLALHATDARRPTIAWQQSDYGLSFDTRIPADEAEHAQVMEVQLRRLTFLRRKFEEDLRSGEKIYVLTRGDCLTEPEALAVFCALNVHGPNTLLWTVFGDESATGRVDEIGPGFLCGHLGWTDHHRYARLEAWRAVLEKC
jgi:hypothetical protein